MNLKLGLEKTDKFHFHRNKTRISIPQVVLGILLVLTLSYFNHVPEGRIISESNIKVGEIAKEDIVVRRDITIEDKETTGLNRKKILDGIIPIYDYLPEKVEPSLMQINDWFAFMKTISREYFNRSRSLEEARSEIEKNFALSISEENLRILLATRPFNQIDVSRLLTRISEWSETGILVSKLGTRKTRDNMIFLVKTASENLMTQMDHLLDLKDVEGRLSDLLSAENRIPELNRQTLVTVLLQFIPITVSYAKELNLAQEKRALETLAPATIIFKKGKVLVRRGDEITPEQMKWVTLISYAEKGKSRRLPLFYLILLFWAMAFLFYGKYQASVNLPGLNRERARSVTFVTLLAVAMAYRVVLYLMPLVLHNILPNWGHDSKAIFYSIPFGFGAIIIAFLFNLQTALLFSVANAVLSGIMCDWSIQLAIFALASNLTVSLAVDYYQRLKRSATLKAGLFWLVPVNVGMVIIMAFSEGSFGWTPILFYSLLGVFSALLASLLASFLIPLWEVMFKLVTDLKLVEITNLNLPIFREMLEKAPGTYHHSQMVAALAEATAEEMSLSPLLLRAMALYHDIGKIENPHFYVENYSVYEDPHTRMSPQESAKAIISHIRAGMETADRLKLPLRVADAISRHHGNKLVKFFYQKALENAREETAEVNTEPFRYPGTKPQEIEDAIVMLADQVEAATKSLSSPKDEDLKNVIEQMIATNIEENQFEECQGLTFMFLRAIAVSFFNKLSSIYHQRISYPGFQFNRVKTNGQNSLR